MPTAPPPQQMPPTTSGPQNAVPCPHCGKPLNFRGHDELLASGVTFKCDYCKRLVEVVRAVDIKWVTVRRPVARR